MREIVVPSVIAKTENEMDDVLSRVKFETEKVRI